MKSSSRGKLKIKKFNPCESCNGGKYFQFSFGFSFINKFYGSVAVSVSHSFQMDRVKNSVWKTFFFFILFCIRTADKSKLIFSCPLKRDYKGPRAGKNYDKTAGYIGWEKLSILSATSINIYIAFR